MFLSRTGRSPGLQTCECDRRPPAAGL
jgi:hypothetical protein